MNSVSRKLSSSCKFILSGLILILHQANAEPLLWENRFGGNAEGYDYVESLLMDSSDDVIVSGRIEAIDATSGRRVNDMVTFKFSGIDGTTLWMHRDSESSYTDDNPFSWLDNSWVPAATVHDELGNPFVYSLKGIKKLDSQDGSELWKVVPQHIFGEPWDGGAASAVYDPSGYVIHM